MGVSKWVCVSKMYVGGVCASEMMLGYMQVRCMDSMRWRR